jgi:hypothetical protein
MRVSARMRDRQGRETRGGGVDMFWVDHGPRLMAALPLADGHDEGRCLNSPHDHDPIKSRCNTPIRVCGASMQRSIRSRTLPRSAA